MTDNLPIGAQALAQGLSGCAALRITNIYITGH
jgi:hypothetical protein